MGYQQTQDFGKNQQKYLPRINSLYAVHTRENRVLLCHPKYIMTQFIIKV